MPLVYSCLEKRAITLSERKSPSTLMSLGIVGGSRAGGLRFLPEGCRALFEPGAWRDALPELRVGRVPRALGRRIPRSVGTSQPGVPSSVLRSVHRTPRSSDSWHSLLRRREDQCVVSGVSSGGVPGSVRRVQTGSYCSGRATALSPHFFRRGSETAGVQRNARIRLQKR